VIDANAIADALGRPRPTAAQREVIESPLAPALVIAGAGSGKTETMAGRVLWLLANGHVTAGEILGLTFTRKAAGELAERIRSRLGQLAAAGLVPDDYDDFDPPVVATYNAFANTIYRDNAMLIGREGDGAVLSEASAWQLARRIVVSSTDPRLVELDKSADAVTKAVLSLAHALNENVADADEVAGMAQRFRSVAQLPPGGRGAYADVDQLAATVGALPVLLELVAEFEREKLRRGFVEYSDQVASALQIVRTAPAVAAELRGRHRVVLLDEYQDTSVVQTWLLSELFAGGTVMAVGDPHQSIYGWRGASAGNLGQFAAQFGAGAASTFSLATSWRNGRRILQAANALVEPLTAATPVPVQALEPSPVASDLPVDVAFEETIDEEAEAVATWLSRRMRTSGDAAPPSAAILFRARKTQQVFIEALRRHGIRYHVLGVGGLMAAPEVADLVSALSVISDPGAGSELVRLLAGSKWRIGVRDLHALSRVASWLRDRDFALRPLDDAVKQTLRSSVAAEDGGSIVDALDFVAHAPDGHSQLAGFSTVGLERLRNAGHTFARLRARAGLDLLDFVAVVQQELMLDIEVAANDAHALGPANMDAFFDAVNGYLQVADIAGLRGFLAWLHEAEWRDNLSPRPEEPEPGTVQLLTIHGSKGLEWDIVVVPRCVEGELPGTPAEGNSGWLRFGALPYEFRGDADDLPHFGWQAAETKKELKDERDLFKERIGEHHRREERRLAYVAVTRARHALLLSGSFWGRQTQPRPPSTFLLPLAERGLIPALPVASEYTENPLGDAADLLTWPLDPLGGRRAAVERAAAMVREAPVDRQGRWQRDVELLLAERAERLAAHSRVPVPARVPASRFKDFVSAPDDVALTLLRPMPERPYRATRLGTLFHRWVEERALSRGTTETIDALGLELDDLDDVLFDGDERDADAVAEAEAKALAGLQSTFERSPWAGRKPVEVEREIHLPFDGRIVICKIDAVYENDGRYDVVDWKTGKPPRDDDDLQRKQLQLALYRLAYARWKGIDESLIDAAFYFVADDTIIRPTHIADEGELLALWRDAMHHA
jgi:DNA helicase-2/ATP-dependent DNA helicase PcrA